MEYVRMVDFAAIDRSGADEYLSQTLFDHASGAKTAESIVSRRQLGVVLRPACISMTSIKSSTFCVAR